jgi:hypothetical protein
VRALSQIDAPQLQPSTEIDDTLLPKEVHRHPDYLRRIKLMAQESVVKKDACFLAGVARATWDRSRKRKREGDAAFKDFPEDYRPSGNPTGHLRFKTAQVIAWANRKMALKK